MECGIFKTTYRADMALLRTPLMRARIGLVLLLAVAFPLVADRYLLNLAVLIGVTIIGAVGLNILTGFTGQISLGHGAFVGVGAYTSAVLTTRYQLAFWLALPVAGLVAAAVGSIFGIPSLRLKGLYLAIATLAAQVIIEWVMYHWTAVTRGSQGINAIPPPVLGPITFNTPRSYYYLTLVTVGIAVLCTANLFRTRLGRAFIAIRDQDVAAGVLGVHRFRTKMLAFALASFYAGVAGSLWAHYLTIITPEHFGLGLSVEYLAMIIIGGLGSVTGAVLGALFLGLLPIVLRNLFDLLDPVFPGIETLAAAIRELLFGLIVILFLLLEPEGLAKMWRDVKEYFRLWPFAY